MRSTEELRQARETLLLANVLEERRKQDEKWGTDFHGRPDEQWLTILTEEVGEAAEAILQGREGDLCEEVNQIAAVCLSWLLYRTPRHEQNIHGTSEEYGTER